MSVFTMLTKPTMPHEPALEVLKTDPRIILRGKLDSLSALISMMEAYIMDEDEVLYEALENVRKIVIALQTAEATGNLFHYERFVEYYDKIQRTSHSIGLLDVQPKHGLCVNMLNYLRTQIRECEVLAVSACTRLVSYESNEPYKSYVDALNCLSSKVHVLTRSVMKYYDML